MDILVSKTKDMGDRRMQMNWKKLIEARRIGNRPPDQDNGRSVFISDHDKITFSGTFRRLAGKTQVHPLGGSDHLHNRMTHSQEMACVGRSLGVRVGEKLTVAEKLPSGVTARDIGDILYSTCLAHDIGTTPFGATGEEAIRNWFQNDGAKLLNNLQSEEANDLRAYDRNAQGFRVLASTEYYPYDGGMRLSYATLASFIRYPWTSLGSSSGKRPKENMYGVFKSELPLFHEVANAVELVKQGGDDWYCQHPLAALMDAVDQFYSALSIMEDGLAMNILTWSQVYDALLPIVPPVGRNELKLGIEKLSNGRKASVIRGRVIESFVEAASTAFLKHEDELLRGEPVDLISKCENGVTDALAAANRLANTLVLNHPRKVELEMGSYTVMATLLDFICNAVIDYANDPNNCSFKTKRVIDLIGANTFDPKITDSSKGSTSRYLSLMRALDFISGCTDEYATYLAKQFNGTLQAR